MYYWTVLIFVLLLKNSLIEMTLQGSGQPTGPKSLCCKLLNLAVAVWKQTQTSHKKWVWLHANKTLFTKTGCGFHLVSRLYFVKLCFKLPLFKVKWLLLPSPVSPGPIRRHLRSIAGQRAQSSSWPEARDHLETNEHLKQLLFGWGISPDIYHIRN